MLYLVIGISQYEYSCKTINDIVKLVKLSHTSQTSLMPNVFTNITYNNFQKVYQMLLLYQNYTIIIHKYDILMIIIHAVDSINNLGSFNNIVCTSTQWNL